MKKITIIAVVLLLILPAGSLAAERALPDAILNVFQTPEWEGYSIPTIPDEDKFGGLLASYYYDENNRAAAFAILKKDDENILCILEKKKGAWVIVAQSSTAIKQGDEIPFISSEMYDQLDINYHRLRSDGQPYLSITVQRLNKQWVISYVSFHPEDTAYLYAQIEKNDLRYAGEETEWETVAVKGYIDNNVELFDLENFPQTIQAAQALFAEKSDD